MKVILFTTSSDSVSMNLLELLNTLTTNQNIEVIRTIDELIVKLRNPRIEPMLAVIQAADRNELKSLINIRDLIDDTRLFLILPDHEPETISKGHSLRPRYITYLDSDYSSCAAVLKNMLERGSNLSVPGNQN